MGKMVKSEGGKLQKYDPDKGLKRLAVAEVAEKHYARAKDVDMLFKAVEHKLTEQRNFVIWWDGQGHNKPGNPILSDRKGLKAGKDGMPDSLTIHRWRVKVVKEEDYATALESAQSRCAQICDGKGQSQVKENTGLQEWYTPPDIIESARLVMGAIDLDPASHPTAQKSIRATKYYTANDDGLSHKWEGRVWMNPPYSQPLIEHFCNKLVLDLESKVTAAISLTNNGTETVWGQTLLGACRAACFPSGRVQFWSGREFATPLQGQMICYFGDAIDKFTNEFSSVGVVLCGQK